MILDQFTMQLYTWQDATLLFSVDPANFDVTLRQITKADLVREDLKSLGIDANVIDRSDNCLITFVSEEDMNMYKMLGKVKHQPMLTKNGFVNTMYYYYVFTG